MSKFGAQRTMYNDDELSLVKNTIFHLKFNADASCAVLVLRPKRKKIFIIRSSVAQPLRHSIKIQRQTVKRINQVKIHKMDQSFSQNMHSGRPSLPYTSRTRQSSASSTFTSRRSIQGGALKKSALSR